MPRFPGTSTGQTGSLSLGQRQLAAQREQAKHDANQRLALGIANAAMQAGRLGLGVFGAAETSRSNRAQERLGQERTKAIRDRLAVAMENQRHTAGYQDRSLDLQEKALDQKAGEKERTAALETSQLLNQGQADIFGQPAVLGTMSPQEREQAVESYTSTGGAPLLEQIAAFRDTIGAQDKAKGITPLGVPGEFNQDFFATASPDKQAALWALIASRNASSQYPLLAKEMLRRMGGRTPVVEDVPVPNQRLPLSRSGSFRPGNLLEVEQARRQNAQNEIMRRIFNDLALRGGEAMGPAPQFLDPELIEWALTKEPLSR